MPVSASGESAARSSQCEPDLVIPVHVVGRERHQPQLERFLRLDRPAEVLAAATPRRRGGRRSGRSRLSPLPIGCAPRLASLSTMAAAGRALRSAVLGATGEHVLPVAGQGQLQQDAGEAAARLDQRDEAAAGHVEPLEGTW